MLERQVGARKTSAIGFGIMSLSLDGRPAERDAIATIHTALEAGGRLIDTADAYSLGEDDFGYSERLVAKALHAWSGDDSNVIVATKGGHIRLGQDWSLNGRPEYLHAACEASLRRLGSDALDLYQFHRPDPQVPFAESVGALRDLRDEGKIRLVGVSNVSIEQIDIALAELGELAAVQNEFSPRFTSSLAELEYCNRKGIAFLAWSPLGGRAAAGSLPGAFSAVGVDHGVSAQQACLAWMLAKSPTLIPISGAGRQQSVTDSAAAAKLDLDAAELGLLDAACGIGESDLPAVDEEQAEN